MALVVKIPPTSRIGRTAGFEADAVAAPDVSKVATADPPRPADLLGMVERAVPVHADSDGRRLRERLDLCVVQRVGLDVTPVVRCPSAKASAHIALQVPRPSSI